MLTCSPLSLLFARALLVLILVSFLPLQPAVCEDLQVQHAELQKALQVGSHWFVCRQTSCKGLLGQSSLLSEARNESGVLKSFTTAYFCWLTGFPGERPAVPRVS